MTNKKTALVGAVVALFLGLIVALIAAISTVQSGASVNIDDIIFAAVAILLGMAAFVGVAFAVRSLLRRRTNIIVGDIPGFPIWAKVVPFVLLALHLFISVANDRNILAPISFVQAVCYLIIGLLMVLDRRSPRYLTIPMIVLGVSSFPAGLLIIYAAVDTRRRLKKSKVSSVCDEVGVMRPSVSVGSVSNRDNAQQ